LHIGVIVKSKFELRNVQLQFDIGGVENESPTSVVINNNPAVSLNHLSLIGFLVHP
jgi:hypothetical protein